MIEVAEFRGEFIFSWSYFRILGKCRDARFSRIIMRIKRQSSKMADAKTDGGERTCKNERVVLGMLPARTPPDGNTRVAWWCPQKIKQGNGKVISAAFF